MNALLERLPEIASFVVGQVVPLATSWFKGNTWSDRQAMVLTIVICALAGAASTAATNVLVLKEGMTLDDWINNAFIVFGSAVGAYKIYFQNTRTNAKLERQGPFSINKNVLAGLIAFLVLGLLAASDGPLTPVHAALAAQITPCKVDVPEREWRQCISLQVSAALEGRAEYVQLNNRVGSLESNGMSAAQERRMNDLAWAKASDRLDLWKRESQAYTDRWFYDRIFERWKIHACRAGVNMNRTVVCP